MPARFRRTVAAMAVWPALIGIATGAARGQTVEPSVEAPVAPSDGPPIQPPVQLSDVSPASGALPPGPPPPRLVRRVRVGLLVAGAAIFLAGWLPALILGGRGGGGCDSQDCRDSFDVLGIPVVGPFLANDKNSNFGLLLPLALVQAGGLAMSIVGLIGHKVPVEPAKSSWRITPTVSPGLAGLAFGATF
jgi:hypothetical protein